MTDGGCETVLATEEDVSGILALQEQNLRVNGGVLSVPLLRDWLKTALSRMPIVVARRGRRVVGYLVSSALADQSDDPILHGMLGAHPGEAGAYVYGPICVAQSERGQGVARAMFEESRARLPGREGFTFIRADNAVSRQFHARMGMRETTHFTVADVDYVVVAYVG